MSPRMPVEYAGVGLEALLKKRADLTEALEGGSLTSAGIAAGIRHDNNPVNYGQLTNRLQRVCLALHLTWLEENPDAPVTENPYPDPTVSRVMQVTTIFQ